MADNEERDRDAVQSRGREVDLVATNREFEQIACIVSHDLKSPLRVVHHLVGFLREDLADAASPRVSEHLDNLERQVTRMSRMLDELRNFVQVRSGGGLTEVVDLEALGLELAEFVGLPDGLALAIDVEHLRVETDRALLSLVLRNLLDNCRKHHDGESGTLRIEARPHKEGSLRFRVTDDGPGIAPCDRKRVLEPFHRPGRSKPDSGMGLSLVKRAVERQGGHIWIEGGSGDSAGRGVTFCFTWPLARHGKPTG